MASSRSDADEIVSVLANENSKEVFVSASSVLITFANNILKNPRDQAFKKIRIANTTVQNKLLSSVGGMECLLVMGFEESADGEYLIFPEDRDLQSIRTMQASLLEEIAKIRPAQTTAQQRPLNQISQRPTASQPPRTSVLQTQSEIAFVGRIKDGMRRVLQYENARIQEKARSTIPVNELQSEADANLKLAQSKGAPSQDIKDYLLLALLKWFKRSFFAWVDTLPCSVCGGATQHNGSVSPSSEDLSWGASRVEAHLCKVCNKTTRFPRYTNPEKLLSTRRGRCGEWADCFTLCCRALGFEARFVMDWTDHVWTEVYSSSKQRWLHCDPCENICDKPLLYESGWGKKLTYVIAVSKDEVQDVTWRYSAKHEEILSRRQLCRESWLRLTVHNMWRQKISSLPEQRQKDLWVRLLCELAEFINLKVNDENLPGRSTGSLAWRQARGELGSSHAVAGLSANNGFTFTPTESERESEIIHIVYDSSTDKYLRSSSANKEYAGWDHCIFKCSNVLRKEEMDWKMTYLARNNNTLPAEITWKFDLTGTDLRIGKVELKAQSAVFESGKVSWRLCAGDNCFSQSGSSLQDFMTFDMKGSKTLTVTAVLQGGSGNNAWQHTQLFRQSSEDTDGHPFDIKLMLN